MAAFNIQEALIWKEKIESIIEVRLGVRSLFLLSVVFLFCEVGTSLSTSAAIGLGSKFFSERTILHLCSNLFSRFF